MRIVRTNAELRACHADGEGLLLFSDMDEAR